MESGAECHRTNWCRGKVSIWQKCKGEEEMELSNTQCPIYSWPLSSGLLSSHTERDYLCVCVCVCVCV